ncbi:MAG: hypothetical protein QMC73_09140 [Myxococcota bacterium]|jgi:hypothetical protein
MGDFVKQTEFEALGDNQFRATLKKDWVKGLGQWERVGGRKASGE